MSVRRASTGDLRELATRLKHKKSNETVITVIRAPDDEETHKDTTAPTEGITITRGDTPAPTGGITGTYGSPPPPASK